MRRTAKVLAAEGNRPNRVELVSGAEDNRPNGAEDGSHGWSSPEADGTRGNRTNEKIPPRRGGGCLGLRHAFARRNVLALAALSVAALSSPTLACSTCFGDPDSQMVKGALMGVYVMIGVVGFVLAGFTGTGLYWIHRSRRLTQSSTETEEQQTK